MLPIKLAAILVAASALASCSGSRDLAARRRGRRSPAHRSTEPMFNSR